MQKGKEFFYCKNIEEISLECTKFFLEEAFLLNTLRYVVFIILNLVKIVIKPQSRNIEYHLEFQVSTMWQPHNGCGLKVGVYTGKKSPPFKFPGSAPGLIQIFVSILSLVSAFFSQTF